MSAAIVLTPVNPASADVAACPGGRPSPVVPAGCPAIAGPGADSGHRASVASVPTIESVSPTSGFFMGATSVVISGSGFTDVTSVTIGALPCLYVVTSTTQITCTAPMGPIGAQDVTVNTSSGSATLAGSYTYWIVPPLVLPILPSTPVPQLTSVLPAAALPTGGGTLTITGTDLTGTTAVTVNGTDCPVVASSATQATCTIPAHAAGTGDVVVTTAGGTATLSSVFTYLPPAPTIGTVNPSSGPGTGATILTVTGSDLTGATAVTVGGTACTGYTVVSATELTCAAPAGIPGSVDVAVTTPSGTATATGAYAYLLPLPSVVSVSPSSGPLTGGPVTITGTDLTGTTAVTVGGQPCTALSVAGPTEVTCTVPTGSAGATTLVLTAPGGTVIKVNFFTYASPPVISAVSPTTAQPLGGGTLTLTGTGLTGTTVVTVGGQACGSLTPVSDTQVTCTLPPGVAGAPSLVVTAPGGSFTASGLFTYYEPPVTIPTEPIPTTPTPVPTPTTSPTPEPSNSTPTPTPTPTPTMDLTLDLRVGEPLRGSQATLTGNGLRARSPYTLTLYSTPVQLAAGYTDQDGGFTGKITLPASACVEGGRHQLVLTGTAPDGTPVHDSSWLVLDSTCTARGVSGSKPATSTVTLMTLHFPHVSAGLTPYVKSVLQKERSTLSSAKSVTVTGFTETDQQSPAAVRANRALSLRRARAVRAYLLDIGLKIPIIAIGRGGVDPVPGKPQSFNRRVTITLHY